MDDDPRFRHLATDPRFKTLRRKQKKVKIDKRFESMFTDEKFKLKYSRDKRGQANKKTTSDDLKKYYSIEDDQPVSDEEKVDDHEDGQSHEDAQDTPQDENLSNDGSIEEHDQDQEASSGSPTHEDFDPEVSSSSDESETEDESSGDELVVDTMDYDWRPLDHDAEFSEKTTHRLAIQNIDWDFIDVKDLYILIKSIRMPLSVRLYVSEFGKERLAREEVEGPKELADMPKVDEVEEEYQQLKEKMRAFKNVEPKTFRVNEYEDADEQVDMKNHELRERIRAYQLNKMKYYYAIAEFDSPESAELVYKELDGREIEGSSIELDLRFVPDDVEFDNDDLQSECLKEPDATTYKAPQFISTALQQTSVKFTWDNTDTKREEKLRRAYTKDEIEKDDLDAYLASETDSDSEAEECDFDDGVSVATGNSEARINKYKMLLKNIEDEEAKKKSIDVDVEWDEPDEDDDHGDDGSEASHTGSSDSCSDDDDLIQVKSNRKVRFSEDEPSSAKKPKAKIDKKKQKPIEKDDQLDLLVMDMEAERDDFKFDPEDPRFEAIYNSGLYNIDPSHPNFKRTAALDQIAATKRNKRRK